MADPTVTAKVYRDFAHTVRVVTARAIAGAERAQTARPGKPAAFLNVVAMAAAGVGTKDLPTGEILSRDGQLGARFEAADGKVRVSLQLKGFSAITAHGGKPARLLTSNGAVDHPFQFDPRGRAVCILLDAEDVRAGLHNFDLAYEPAGT